MKNHLALNIFLIAVAASNFNPVASQPYTPFPDRATLKAAVNEYCSNGTVDPLYGWVVLCWLFIIDHEWWNGGIVFGSGSPQNGTQLSMPPRLTENNMNGTSFNGCGSGYLSFFILVRFKRLFERARSEKLLTVK